MQTLIQLLFRLVRCISVFSVVPPSDKNSEVMLVREYRLRRVVQVLMGLKVVLLLTSFTIAQSGRVAPPTPTPTPKDDDAVRVATEEIKLNVTAFDANGEFVGDVK